MLGWLPTLKVGGLEVYFLRFKGGTKNKVFVEKNILKNKDK